MVEGYVNIENGVIQNFHAFQQKVATLKDGRHYFKLEPKNKRTLSQNAWLHAILPDMVKPLQDLGWYEIRTSVDVKKFIKSLFFRKTITNGTLTQEIVEDTSDTSKEDFTERAEAIIVWASDYLGIDIAPPGKQTTLYPDTQKETTV